MRRQHFSVTLLIGLVFVLGPVALSAHAHAHSGVAGLHTGCILCSLAREHISAVSVQVDAPMPAVGVWVGTCPVPIPRSARFTVDLLCRGPPPSLV